MENWKLRKIQVGEIQIGKYNPEIIIRIYTSPKVTITTRNEIIQIGKYKTGNSTRKRKDANRKIQTGKYKSRNRNQQNANRKIPIGKPFTISHASS